MRAHVLACLFVSVAASLCGGCNSGIGNSAGRSLGDIALVERRSVMVVEDSTTKLGKGLAAAFQEAADPQLIVTVHYPGLEDKAAGTDMLVDLLPVYRIDWDRSRTTTTSLTDWVYRVADVSALDQFYALGADWDETTEKNRRRIIATKLLSIADSNGQEYWRRFHAISEYGKAVADSTNALMGAGIASSFISPVVGASLAGAGLTIKTFADDVTANFDPTLYAALHGAVVAAASTEREKIKAKFDLPYKDYPAQELAQDIVAYAQMYSLRGAAAIVQKSTSSTAASAPMARPSFLDAFVTTDNGRGITVRWQPVPASGDKLVLIRVLVDQASSTSTTPITLKPGTALKVGDLVGGLANTKVVAIVDGTNTWTDRSSDLASGQKYRYAAAIVDDKNNYSALSNSEVVAY